MPRKMNAQLIQKYFISEYNGHRYMSLMSVFKLPNDTGQRNGEGIKEGKRMDKG